MQTFAERLRTLRESKGMSQTELAKEIGVNREQVNRWENGALHNKNPTLNTMQSLAAGLGVKVKDLVDDDECNQTGALLAKIVSTENERLEAMGALEDAYARIGHTVALLRQRHAKEQPPYAGRP